MNTRISAVQAKAMGIDLDPRQRKRSAKRAEPDATGLFEALCVEAGFQAPIPEFCFAPPRRFRWDWAFPESKLAIEQQGGQFTGGRHVRGAALMQEYEKLNLGAIMGWRILFLTPGQFASGDVIAILQRAFEGAER